jgi:predicted DNA-binding transcriptional regulator AlpA
MEARKGPIGGSTKMLKSAEVAERLGMSLKTFHNTWKQLGIPCYQRGHWLRFMERDVQFWLEQHRVS